MADLIPVPVEVVAAVERYVDSELDDVRKYDNRAPLDTSGVFSLHQLAAVIYQGGWDAGARAEAEKQRRARQRFQAGVTG